MTAILNEERKNRHSCFRSSFHALIPYQECACSDRRRDRMRELPQQLTVRKQCDAIIHLRPAVVDRETNRPLHEGVRCQNPEGGQHRADGDQPDAGADAPSWDTRSHPKIHRPIKVDSRKKASSASIASGAPKTSPTKRENSDQFIPNWNSCKIPVTMPTAKLMSRNSPPELRHLFVFLIHFDDIYSFHNRDQQRKANRDRDEDEVKIVVEANCRRAKSNTSMPSLPFKDICLSLLRL